MHLFFVLIEVQTLPVWILAEFNSVRNQIDKAVYKRLHYQTLIRDRKDVNVIGGNGDTLDVKGVTVLLVSLGSNRIWHEFGVVSKVSFKVFIKADVVALPLCWLDYLKNKKKRLHFGFQVCPSCSR